MLPVVAAQAMAADKAAISRIEGDRVFIFLRVFALRRDSSQHLFGWQLDQGRREMKEMPGGPGGRLWSVQLESFLVPEGEVLRLYDRYGQLRLTQAEAEADQVKLERQNRIKYKLQKIAFVIGDITLTSSRLFFKVGEYY